MTSRDKLRSIFAAGVKFTIEGARYPYFYRPDLKVKDDVIQAFESAAISAIESGKTDEEVQQLAMLRARIVYQEARREEIRRDDY